MYLRSRADRSSHRPPGRVLRHGGMRHGGMRHGGMRHGGMRRWWGALLASSALLLMPATGRTAAAQSAAISATATRSTVDGVYTSAQAKRGRDVYLTLCQSCHSAASHTGPPFRTKWVGRPLADLYSFITQEMPKTEPGSLTPDEYTVVLAYMLRMNGMPSGRSALSSDDAVLRAIRIDLPDASAPEGRLR